MPSELERRDDACTRNESSTEGEKPAREVARSPYFDHPIKNPQRSCERMESSRKRSGLYISGVLTNREPAANESTSKESDGMCKGQSEEGTTPALARTVKKRNAKEKKKPPAEKSKTRAWRRAVGWGVKKGEKSRAALSDSKPEIGS